MYGTYIGVGVFFLLGVAFVAGTFSASWLLRPHHAHAEKLVTYECGEKPTGGAWVQFRIIFYLFALIFVVFDVEVVFVIPWAVAFKDLCGMHQALFALGEMLTFMAILMVGWLFAYRRGCFEWE